MAKLIRANGTVETVEPKNGTNFLLEELQGYVGGYVQILDLKNQQKLMVVNEEGRPKMLRENRQATDAMMLGEGRNVTIVGDVLICNYDEVR